MPSIHPAIISLFGCFLWNYGFLGKTTAVVYNVLMLIALVYLGEHYVVDTLVEIFMVIFAWILSGKILIGCSNLKGNHINLVCRLENQLR